MECRALFEMHEVIETVWHGCQGSERKALKGLIQVAGVYVHLRRNKLMGALGLTRRARENILAEPNYLKFVRNLGQLVEHLFKPQLAPPKLRPDNFWKKPPVQ